MGAPVLIEGERGMCGFVALMSQANLLCFHLCFGRREGLPLARSPFCSVKERDCASQRYSFKPLLCWLPHRWGVGDPCRRQGDRVGVGTSSFKMKLGSPPPFFFNKGLGMYLSFSLVVCGMTFQPCNLETCLVSLSSWVLCTVGT